MMEQEESPQQSHHQGTRSGTHPQNTTLSIRILRLRKREHRFTPRYAFGKRDRLFCVRHRSTGLRPLHGRRHNRRRDARPRPRQRAALRRSVKRTPHLHHVAKQVMRFGVGGICSKPRTGCCDRQHGKQIGMPHLRIGVQNHPGMRRQIAAKGTVLLQPRRQSAQRLRRPAGHTRLRQKRPQFRNILRVARRHILNLHWLQHTRSRLSPLTPAAIKVDTSARAMLSFLASNVRL